MSKTLNVTHLWEIGRIFLVQVGPEWVKKSAHIINLKPRTNIEA